MARSANPKNTKTKPHIKFNTTPLPSNTIKKYLLISSVKDAKNKSPGNYNSINIKKYPPPPNAIIASLNLLPGATCNHVILALSNIASVQNV
jgi:hypothetical protein